MAVSRRRASTYDSTSNRSTPLEAAPPLVRHMMVECAERPRVGGHRGVREVARDHGPQPAPLFGDGVVPAVTQLRRDLPKRGSYTGAPSFAMKQECSPPGLAADAREPQEGEWSCLAQPAPLRRVAAMRPTQSVGPFPRAVRARTARTACASRPRIAWHRLMLQAGVHRYAPRRSRGRADLPRAAGRPVGIPTPSGAPAQPCAVARAAQPGEASCGPLREAERWKTEQPKPSDHTGRTQKV